MISNSFVPISSESSRIMAISGFSPASIPPCGKPQLVPSARLPSQILFSLLRIMAATFEISDASFNLEMIKRFHLSEALGGKVALPGTDIYDIKRVFKY